MPLPHARRSVSSLLTAVALVWVLAGCSSGSTSTSPSTTPTPTATPTATPTGTPTGTATAVCADAKALRASLAALENVNVRRNGSAALESALADVKTKLDATVASASGALKPQVDQVKTAFEGLQSATTGLTKDNLAAKAPAIRTALTQLGTATKALASTLSQDCPAS